MHIDDHFQDYEHKYRWHNEAEVLPVVEGRRVAIVDGLVRSVASFGMGFLVYTLSWE